jgi:hypothetical protein
MARQAEGLCRALFGISSITGRRRLRCAVLAGHGHNFWAGLVAACILLNFSGTHCILWLVLLSFVVGISEGASHSLLRCPVQTRLAHLLHSVHCCVCLLHPPTSASLTLSIFQPDLLPCAPLQLLLLGKPGSQLSAVPGACKLTFAEMDAALGTLRRGLAAIDQELKAEEAAATLSAEESSSSSRISDAGHIVSEGGGAGTPADSCSDTNSGGEAGQPAPYATGSGSSSAAYLAHLRELRSEAAATLRHAEDMLRSARSRCAAALEYLGEGKVPLDQDTPASREALTREPKRLLGDLDEFLRLMQQAHADARRMSVCLARLQAQQAEALGSPGHQGSPKEGVASHADC